MIDHALLLQCLSQTDESIANGVRVIAKQREVITALKADGRAMGEAENMLVCFEQAHATNLAARDTIMSELARTKWT
jgi:hypothetical protein